MPTDLKQKYSPEWLGVPPHMAREDYQIWIKCRKDFLTDAINVYYDVGVGNKYEVEGGGDPKVAAMWSAINQKRIDVIVEYQDHIKIIELRFEAKLDAIGRLAGYGLLYSQNPILTKPFKLVLVTNLNDQDLRDTCASLGFDFFIV